MELQTPLGSPVSSSAPSTGARLFSAVATTILFLLAGGGAAAGPAGALFGIPSFGVVMVSLAFGALVWASATSGPGGFLIAAVALLAGAFIPGASALLLFSGPPLFAFALAGVVLAVVAKGVRPPRALLFPAFFVIYSAVAFQVQTRVGPDGDEPQYLMVAQSLVQDHDLVLDQDFQEKRYQAFFSRPLEPHFRIRGPEGQIYSLHAVGLPVLILPAYALLGYPGASFFMALLAAWLIRELRELIGTLTGDERVAEGTAWLIGLSPPVIHFAGLIFTEIPAALLLCLGLRTAVFGKGARPALVAAACAAALPWLNVRYGILALAIVVALAWRLWNARGDASGEARFPLRSWWAPASILAGSALAIGLYHFELWGFFDPRRVYGRKREFSLDILPEGLPGLFFDQEFGLFVYAPIFVLSLAGFVFLWRRQRSLAIAGLIALGGVVATASVWPMWRGGFNPPARFLVPLVSVLGCGLALTLQRGVRPATALLAGWSLWCGLGGAMNIATIHRDRDGVAPFFRTQSGAVEWTTALPSFVLSEDRPTRFLAWPWALLLALPAGFALRVSARTPAGASNAVLVSVAFIATAALAARVSPRVPAPERDATRLLGRAAISLTPFQVQSGSEAAWSVAFFYEPHRNPQGATFARAVHLQAGPYEIHLDTDASAIADPPSFALIKRGDALTRRSSVRADAGRLNAPFDVTLAGDYDFAFIGGEPLTVNRAVLRIRKTD